MQSRVKALTMTEVLFPRTTLVRDVLLVLSFTVVTALCAQVSFRIGVVPITGQTFAVLLAGALLGSRLGALSQLTYLAVGAMGAPIFANWMGGPAVLVGPTGGYLMGFVPAAFAVGLMVERGWDRRVWSMGIAMLLGLGFIYAFGLSWLAHFVPKGTVLSAGLYPFIPGELVKLALLAGAVPTGWVLLNRLRK